MLGITVYFWRLVPANPILLRVVESGGRRVRDLLIRCGYLGMLIGLVVFSLMTSSDLGSANLSSLAKTSASLFQSMSYLQLGLVALLAPIFTAGAITQEKDSQTYDILLATPLSNGQIVLGSLLSRLFFIIALLVSGIPIFSITQIFGGVAIRSIAVSFGLAAATAFATGALAMAIATFKVGTRRTIFSFYLFIVIYMGGMVVLDQFQQFWVPGRILQQGKASHISWFTGLNPFLALRVIFKDPEYAPPNLEDLAPGLQGGPIGWYLSNPTGFYISFMFFFSFVLVTPSIVLLRRMAQSTTSIRTLVLQKLKIVSADRTRKPRTVWSNPIAWREARTKASAARATVLRYGFILAGVTAAILVLARYATVQTRAIAIRPGSYDSVHDELTLPGADGESRQTYRIIPGKTSITLRPREGAERGPEFDLRDLRGVMEVVESKVASEAVGEAQSGRLRQANVLESVVLSAPARVLDPDLARKYLLGACAVEFAVILLIVTNAAASTVTREKEDGTLDLLLSSPITSRYYIWGKLRGLVSFVLPLIAVPVFSVLLFVIYDAYRRFGAWNDASFEWLVFPEAVLLLPGMLIIVAAFAAILGMQMSLRCRTTTMAVMSSVGIVVGIYGGMGWCGYGFLQNTNNWFALAVGSFSPFTLMQMLVDPYTSAGNNFHNLADEDLTSNRLVIFFFAIGAVGAYSAIVGQMYASMVKNFDMTIRKQSR